MRSGRVTDSGMRSIMRLMYSAPPLMLCSGSRRSSTSTSSAVASVSIMIPRTVVGLTASSSQWDS